jgi:hypothetical protein
MSMDILGGPRTLDAAVRVEASQRTIERVKAAAGIALGVGVMAVTAESSLINSSPNKAALTVAGLGIALVSAANVATDGHPLEWLEGRFGKLANQPAAASPSVGPEHVTMMQTVLAEARQQKHPALEQ